MLLENCNQKDSELSEVSESLRDNYLGSWAFRVFRERIDIGPYGLMEYDSLYYFGSITAGIQADEVNILYSPDQNLVGFVDKDGIFRSHSYPYTSSGKLEEKGKISLNISHGPMGSPTYFYIYGEKQVSSNNLIKAPDVVTNFATFVSSTSATLNGTVIANFSSTSVAFEFGETLDYRSTIVPLFEYVEGFSINYVKTSVKNLIMGKLYHFRLKATNSMGTTVGNDMIIKISEPVEDIDGNEYNTVSFGTQVWMAENLKTTHFSNGSPILLVTNENSWSSLSTPGYCWYNNDKEKYGSIYGALYNWYTINAGKLCPSGWHVPNDSEWNKLIRYLGGKTIEGDLNQAIAGKLKDSSNVYWENNTGSTNESGFTALPGGCRESTSFSGIRSTAYFWSASELNPDFADSKYIYRFNCIPSFSKLKKAGLSVRCIKD